MAGRFDTDGFPTEAELARQCGTSRGAAREIVKMLTAKGLLRARPRQGTSVEPHVNWHLLDPDVLRWLKDRRASPELLRAFTEMRLAFEPEAAGLASARRSAASREGLQRAIERLDAAAAGGADPTGAAVAFHVAVLDAADNPFLSQLAEFVTTAATLSARLTRRASGFPASLLKRRLAAQAVLSGDPAGARERMRALLLDEADLVERLAARR